FTVNDTTPPHINSCALPQNGFADGTCMAPVPDFTNGVDATDNCVLPGDLIKTQVPPAGTMVGLGIHDVTIFVTDTANPGAPSVSCPTTFTVTNITPPHIVSCPGDLHLFFDANCQQHVPDLTGLVVATDNCNDPATLIKTQTPPAGELIQGPNAE